MNSPELVDTGLSVFLPALSLFIATLAASPLLVQLYAYTRMEPLFEVNLSYHGEPLDEIEWWRLDSEEVVRRIDGDCTIPTVNFRNMSNSDIYIDKVEFRFKNGKWDAKDEYKDVITDIGTGRYLVDPGFVSAFPGSSNDHVVDSEFMPSKTGGGPAFPFQAEETDLELEIEIHHSVDANEIEFPLYGPLPRFYGRIDLKPVKNSYKITA